MLLGVHHLLACDLTNMDRFNCAGLCPVSLVRLYKDGFICLNILFFLPRVVNLARISPGFLGTLGHPG